jgi:hypothetical protein
MKWCRSCGRLSVGRPLFCAKCGRSFDVRVCPRGHINRRDSAFCGVCGSAELSSPGKRARAWPRVAAALALLLLAGLFGWYCLALLVASAGPDLSAVAVCVILLLVLTTTRQPRK